MVKVSALELLDITCGLVSLSLLWGPIIKLGIVFVCQRIGRESY
jgi:hypothetical protein